MKIAIYGSRHQSGYIGYIADWWGNFINGESEVLMAEKAILCIWLKICPSAPEVDSVVGNSQISQYADLAFSIGGAVLFCVRHNGWLLMKYLYSV